MKVIVVRSIIHTFNGNRQNNKDEVIVTKVLSKRSIKS